MQRIKALHVIHSFGIGGMEKGIAMLINNASPEFEHEILCLTCSGDSRHLIPASIPIHEMHKPAGNSFRFINQLARKIKQIKPDVVHSRNWGGMDAIIAARLAGCRAVVHGEHGWGMDDPLGRSSKRKFLRRLLSLGVTEFTAVSQQIEIWLKDDVRVFRPVTQIYNGVEPSLVCRNESGNFLRDELNLPQSALLVGTVGRLDPIKDQAGLICSFKTLREHNPQAHLIIVGDGPERERLESLSAEGIHLLGMRDDVAAILQSLDIFVLSSINEGISNTILEAMVAGLPIVATAVGGTPELIQSGNNGLLVPARDYSAFLDAVSCYLSNPELRAEHGHRNREIIEDRFSIGAMVSSYEEVWKRASHARRLSGYQ